MNPNEKQTELKKTLEQIRHAFLSGKHSRVIELCTELIANAQLLNADEDILSATYLNRGVSKRITGDKQGALEDYAQSSQLDPHSYHPHLDAALVYCEDLEDYKNGLEEFDKALRLNPTGPNILSSRGVAKYSTGDYNGAEADYLAALTITPKDPNIFFNYGNLQMKQNKVKEAAETYQKGLTLNPKDYEMRMKLAIALEQLGDQQASKDVLKVDQRSVQLYMQKKGIPLRPPNKGCTITVFLLVVAGILALTWFIIMKIKG